jgi:SAM-dependent methyltransferase
LRSDRESALNDYWDCSRPYYERALEKNPVAAPERAYLFGFLQAGDSVLDLGAGTCDNSLWIPPGCRYVGVDVSTTGLAMAREMGRPALEVRSQADDMPFPEASFRAVISTWAIEHFHDPGRTLLEAVRVLAPGGLLLLVGSSWDLPYSLAPSVDPARRLEVAARRLWRQLSAWITGRHTFDIVREPRVLDGLFLPDADAVHLTQSFLVRRFLVAAGMEIVEQQSLTYRDDVPLPSRAFRALLRTVPLWRWGWGNILVVARRAGEWRRPPYELRSI